ncbi:MAG: glycogen/starch/alpha-glucan family phosphorylase, partial [Verrucomicrobiae bacterium]|nr:glycogen/starch/alpha-glucan family phosphorylase [Verrucomicrobiae bacterium]
MSTEAYPDPQSPSLVASCGLDNSVASIKQSIRDHLVHTLAVDVDTASSHDWWIATCMTVRDRILERSSNTRHVHRSGNVKRLYYFSLEYLMGRLLENNLISIGVFEATDQALREMGRSLGEVIDKAPDMGLGNGGLGRLAACFIDSLATLDLPAIGYGINYEFGLFRQSFVDGRQVESPDDWRRWGNPWEICRPDRAVEISLYGRVEHQFDDLGEGRMVWTDTRTMLGVPWDLPVAGYGCGTVNFLRLWESRASKDFDLNTFNEGGYVEAVREKALSETVSKVLYPNDETEMGKELRLVQQYFFVACSLRDILTRYRWSNDTWEGLPEKAAIQLNDTHPAIAVAELMRLLVDEELMPWNQAWQICQRTFAYTNHTLLPEALERWSVPLFEKVLPRHLQIIFEINRRFLVHDVEAKWPGDDEKKAHLSLIEEGHTKMIRMAHLAVIGSHTTNGVAALHTELLKRHLFHDFNELFPGRFQNKTNGITPRRWLKVCNHSLSHLIDRSIGADWPRNLDRLRDLEPFIDDPNWRSEFHAIKRQNKERLAGLIKKL